MKIWVEIGTAFHHSAALELRKALEEEREVYRYAAAYRDS